VGRFAKQAPWVREIYSPSGTPAVTEPSAVSDDVQLTSDYLAGGQTDSVPEWFHSNSLTNPGINNQAALVSPITFATGSPEVWRVFWVSFQIPAGLAAVFLFDLFLDFPGGGAAFFPVIKAPVLLPVPSNNEVSIIQPADRLLLPSNGFQGNLPAGEAKSVNLVMIQRSGQAVGTLAIEIRSFILRNPQGVAHLF